MKKKSASNQDKDQKISVSYTGPDDPIYKRVLIGGIEKVSGRLKLEQIYNDIKARNLEGFALWEAIIKAFNIVLEYDQTRLTNLPKDKPLVFIANHPFGVLDGLILSYLIAQVADEFYVLVNKALCKEPMLAKYFLPIDFEDTKEAKLTNIQTRNDALMHLKNGKPIAIFPAGGVATAKKPIVGKAYDLQWKRFVIKLITKNKATVVPIYFEGQNSRLFQLASHIHLNIRLSVLLHEAKNKIGKQIKVQIGNPIPPEEWHKMGKNDELLHNLRKMTYQLSEDKKMHKDNPPIFDKF